MSEQAIASKFALLSRLGKTHGRYLWIAGVILYLGIIAYIGWEDIGSALGDLDYRYLAAFMLLEAIVLRLRAWKWRIALGPDQKALRACFISKAGGNLTPRRVGEFSPLLMEEHRSAKIGAWILLDLVIAYLLFMCFGVGVALTVLALAQLVHALVSVVPIAPNATGIPYAAAAAVIYETAGVPFEVLAIAVGRPRNARRSLLR